MEGDNQIEIELIEHGAPERTTGSASTSMPTVVTVVAIVAVLVGVAAGWWARGSSEDDAGTDAAGATTTTPSTPAPTTTDPMFAGDPIDEPAPSTTAPPPTTTEPPVRDAGLADEVIGLPLRIVMVDVRDIVEIDFATNERRLLWDDSSEGSINPTGYLTMAAGPDWTYIGNDSGASILHDDGRVVSIGQTNGFPELLGYTERSIWIAEYEDTGVPRAVEWMATGEPSGRSIELPTYPLHIDDDGALLSTGNGVYRFSDSAERIARGDFVALGPNHVIVNECDDNFECVRYRYPLSGGEPTAVAAPATDAAVFGVFWYGSQRQLSANGQWQFIYACDGDPVNMGPPACMRDVDAGRQIEAPELAGLTSVSWSPDRNLGVVSGSNGVWVFDGDTGAFIDTGLLGVGASPDGLAVRPDPAG